MVSCMVQSIAVMMGCAATLLTCAIIAMPQWRMSIIVESNSYGKRIDGHWIGRWDGLWVTCVRPSSSPMSCEPYSQTFSMTSDLKVTRVLISFALLVAVSGCGCSFLGMLFDKCCKMNKKNRRCFLLLAGLSFILAGFLILAPVVFIAINIARGVCFSNCKNVQQQQIGEAIMLAWPTVMMFFIGGSIFCWYHPCLCSEKRCICPSDDSQPDGYEVESHCAQELQVLKPNRRQNQDIVI
ncbi:hypothetical protein PRIEUP_LOCUS11923 [Pristimantis euphronides]